MQLKRLAQKMLSTSTSGCRFGALLVLATTIVMWQYTPVSPGMGLPSLDIAPTVLEIHLDADSQRTYSAFLKNTQGTTTFKVVISPDADIEGNIDNWELELHRMTRNRTGEDNLLAPTRIWHGIQRFHFGPLTLSWPIETGYGRIRPFRLPSFTLLAVVEDFQLAMTGRSIQSLSLRLYVIRERG